jgi:hypothetical protein
MALFALLMLGCSRPTTESKATPNEPLPTATLPAANDAGPTFVVRIHRYGGGPHGLDHTFEVAPDGSAHLTGHDSLWCRGSLGSLGTKPSHAGAPVDARVPLDPAVFAEVRELSMHPEVARFAGAQGPARAPQYDGVAAEVTLPAQAPILVDGVREVAGKMGRLLDLDRELAARYGAAAAGCN